MSVADLFIIGVHALVAWMLIEVFVNTCHRLSRKKYVSMHYFAVIVSFAIVFSIYFSFFSGPRILVTTLTALVYVFVFELTVFRYLYIGDRWFLNFVDWIFPIFLATSTIYLSGYLFI